MQGAATHCYRAAGKTGRLYLCTAMATAATISTNLTRGEIIPRGRHQGRFPFQREPRECRRVSANGVLHPRRR